MFVHTNTHPETFTPLIDCVIDDSLLKTTPDVDQAMLQFISIVNLVDSLLHFSPSFVINRIQICALGGLRSDEMNADVCRFRRSIVSRAR